MTEFIIVFCTTNSIENAEKIAKTIAEEKLAACTNIICGISSVYMWKEKLIKDNEVLMIIKTKKNLFEKLKARITELHPYDVPEIISTKISSGSEKYLKWLSKL